MTPYRISLSSALWFIADRPLIAIAPATSASMAVDLVMYKQAVKEEWDVWLGVVGMDSIDKQLAGNCGRGDVRSSGSFLCYANEGKI
jgi:hypothetical protein